MTKYIFVAKVGHREVRIDEAGLPSFYYAERRVEVGEVPAGEMWELWHQLGECLQQSQGGK